MPNHSSFAPFRRLYGLILFVGVTVLTGVKNIPKGAMVPARSVRIGLRFRATLHGKPFLLHKDYVNALGESFRLDLFRFYVGKINGSRAGRSMKKKFAPADYHLVDFSDSLTTRISASLPDDNYDELRIQLGIDSADQQAGAQTGALDPLRGMFWTWNTGYIAVKIEGRSPQSKAPAHTIAYHLGGYRFPDSTWRTLAFSVGAQPEPKLRRKDGDDWEILIEMDKFFDGAKALHIGETPACTTPGALAARIFDGFCNAFTGHEMADHP